MHAMKKEYEHILQQSTLLIVDDNENLRKKFVQVLSSYVDTVYQASNGEEAIDLFTQFKPNIIISDYKMPVMDGLAFISFVRRVNTKIPIVVMSAYSDSKALIKFIELHLLQYILKPVEFNDLNDVLIQCAEELVAQGLVEVSLSSSCIYSFSSKSLLVGEKKISLSLSEFKLLELLIENRGKLVSNDMIEYEIYRDEPSTDSAITNLVSKLRKKTGVATIKTIPKTGFILIH